MQKRFLGQHRLLVTFTILIALSVVYSQLFNAWHAHAAGTISGRVFQDFNGNGSYDATATYTSNDLGAFKAPVDRGVQNVQVRAFDPAGTNVTTGGFVITDASGNYTLTTTDASSGPYRIEFTNLPSGLSPLTRKIDNAETGAVKFASTPATGVDLAVSFAANYSQNDSSPLLVSFPYSSPAENPQNDNENVLPNSSPFTTIAPGSSSTFNNIARSSALNPNTPTAVKLESFEAYTDGGSVSLKWTTGGEAGNLGFNVYRETNGRRELLTASPIAGSALRSSVALKASGEGYGWIDDEPKFNSVYYLEDLDVNGTSALHGPIAPMFKAFINKYDRQSLLLSDLARVEKYSAQREFVGETEPRSRSSFDEISQWQIAGQNGVKIVVNHDGWYRVSAAQLESAGFDASLNQSNWQLFAGTIEVPIKILGDGSIEFFGRGTDTPATDRQIYYLINGASQGARVSEIKGGNAFEISARSYTTTVQRKDRSMYVSALFNGDAENWFGAMINRSAQTEQTLTVNKPDINAPAHLSIRLQGFNAGEHIVNVKFNDVDLGSVSFSDQQNRQFEFDLPVSVNEGANSVKLQSIGTTSDYSLVDSISLRYARRYEASNDKLRFSLAAGETARVGGFTTGKINVYEIQSGYVARGMAVQYFEADGGGYGFELGSANYNREFIAAAQAESPVGVEKNNPSNWNAATNRADFVIIAPAMLQAQATNLATIRQTQGLKTQVVLTEDIADEFGAGILTSDAVKQFLQTAATTWELKPKYALLFGDSSFDMRNYLAQPNRNLVPTRLVDTNYMETSSDGWLADFDGDGIENIAIGRLPASTEAEANLMIAKLMRYDAQPSRTEKINVMPVDRYFETYSDQLLAEMPNNVQKIRIHRSDMTDAAMRSAILTNLNNGPMVVTYIGHGSTGVWSSAAIFSYADAANLNNSQLSIYLLMTCLNAYTHNTSGDSVAEAALKAENGGAAAVWSSSGVIVAENQYQVTSAMTRAIFRQNNRQRIGEIMRQAKSATIDSDVRRTWMLVGDPTLFVK